MSIAFRHVDSPIDEQLSDALAELFKICFQQSVDQDFSERMNAKLNLHVIVAESEGELIGFKLGYEKFHGVFFSWLGGVKPSHRRSGVAKELLHQQHLWCSEAGYREIQTETFGDGAAMLVLNLLEGFEVYGTYAANDRKIRVQLRKYLK